MNTPHEKLVIDDSASDRRLLESWMLFPEDGGDHELLRWSYMRNAMLDELEIDLKESSKLDSFECEQEEEIVNSGYIHLFPRQKSKGPEMVYIFQATLAKLLKRPTALCFELSKKHSVDGLVAGSLLLYMRLLEQNNIASPTSFDKAKAISEMRDSPNRRVQNYSSSSIRPREKYPDGVLDDTWKKYSKVAHLWAALHALNQFSFNPLSRPLEGILIQDLLLIGSAYEKWGISFFSNDMNRKLRKNNRYNPVSFIYNGKFKSSKFDFKNLPYDDIAMKLILKTHLDRN